MLCCGHVRLTACLPDTHAQVLSAYQRAHVFTQLPSLLEFFGFVFAFGNLLAGPVIEFRDYQMWVNSEGPWAKNAGRKIPWTGDMRAVSVCGLARRLGAWGLSVHASVCRQKKERGEGCFCCAREGRGGGVPVFLPACVSLKPPPLRARALGQRMH